MKRLLGILVSSGFTTAIIVVLAGLLFWLSMVRNAPPDPATSGIQAGPARQQIEDVKNTLATAEAGDRSQLPQLQTDLALPQDTFNELVDRINSLESQITTLTQETSQSGTDTLQNNGAAAAEINQLTDTLAATYDEIAAREALALADKFFTPDDETTSPIDDGDSTPNPEPNDTADNSNDDQDNAGNNDGSSEGGIPGDDDDKEDDNSNRDNGDTQDDISSDNDRQDDASSDGGSSSEDSSKDDGVKDDSDNHGDDGGSDDSSKDDEKKDDD